MWESLTVLTVSPAAQATSPDPWLQLVNYGVLGLLVLALVLGKVVPGYLFERRLQEAIDLRLELKDKDREIARLHEYIQEGVIPALIRATDVQARLLAEMPQPPSSEPGGKS